MKDILDYEEKEGVDEKQKFVRKLILVFFLSLSIGMLSRYSRPYLNNNGIHIDAIGALFLLISILLFLLYQFYTTLSKEIAQKLSFELLFQIYNITLWITFAFGWTLLEDEYGYTWEGFIQTCIFLMIGTGIAGWIIIKFMRYVKKVYRN